MKSETKCAHRLNNHCVCLATFFLVGIPTSVSALSFDFRTQPLTTEPNSISVTTEGVTATARAYHVEFDDNASTIFGPFTTGTVEGRPVFNTGLGLTSVEDLGQTDFDTPAASVRPGFDNQRYSPFVFPDNLPTTQFALFNFDSPVDISQVIVDDVSNYGRDIWVAGGSSAPDLSSSLVDAFSEFDVINSPDSASDGVFAHDFDQLLDISFLAVGAPIPIDVGDRGPFTTGGSQFFINALNFEISDTDSGDPNGNGSSNGDGVSVSEPATLSLLGLSMALLSLTRRRAKH